MSSFENPLPSNLESEKKFQNAVDVINSVCANSNIESHPDFDKIRENL